MDKVDINLLPTEVTVEQQKQSKFIRVQAISIGVLLVLILLASISVAFRVLQGQQLKKLGEEGQKQEEQVSSFKDKEAVLVVLKNRVAAISQLVKGEKLQSVMFNLVTDKVPTNVSITAVSVDRAGNVVISVLVPDSNALEQTLNALTSAEAFEKIGRVDIESLSLNKDGIFRMNLKIFTKGAKG